MIKKYFIQPIILIIILGYSFVVSFIITLFQIMHIWSQSMKDTYISAMLSFNKKPKK